MHEKVIHIHIWELAFINGHGPRWRSPDWTSSRATPTRRGREAQEKVADLERRYQREDLE